MIRRLLPLASVVVAALGAACGTSGDDAESSEGAFTGAPSVFGDETSLFKDDRVGRMLMDKLGDIPSDYPSFEKLFKVGRECARGDGKKEIYIVEEAATRPVEGGSQASGETSTLMPRAVITGCNTGNTGDAATVKNSYSLMAALISTDSEPGSAQGDTMSMTPLEVMAFDDKTGLYNFYVFQPGEKGKPGTVTRFFRDKDGKVFMRRLVSGQTTPTAAQPAPNNACFRCHVNGAPLMNELSEPWTNWISPKKRLPTAKMAGVTKELVEKASLADQLETIIRAGTEDYVSGAGKPFLGWVNKTRDAKLPGGMEKLLEPLFCETELHYVSSDTRLGLPRQVFFDPAVTKNAGLTYPGAPAGARPVPFLFPIRALHNAVVDNTLVKREYLTDGMRAAIRLIDDENDIFSSKRCGLFEDVKKELAKATAGEADKKVEPKDVKELLKRVITAKIPSLELQPAHRAYLETRLAGRPHEKEEIAYNAELQQRFSKIDKSPEEIVRRDAARKQAASKMFPDDALNPKPVFPAD